MQLDSRKLIQKSVMRVLFYSIALTAMTYLILFDASIIRHNNLFSENSLTEITQIIFLSCIVVLLLIDGMKNSGRQTVSFFLMAAFLCALIREMDSSFDAVFDGAWQLSVCVVIAALVPWLYQRKDRFFTELSAFITSPAFGILFCGFLTVMVFSRFFGREVLWVEIMGDGFIRSVKNVVEEGVELFGYYLCLIACFEYFLLPDFNKSSKEHHNAILKNNSVLNEKPEVEAFV